MKDLIIFIIVMLLWAYVTWNGIKINIKSGKFNFDFEIYSLKRFFNK